MANLSIVKILAALPFMIAVLSIHEVAIGQTTTQATPQTSTITGSPKKSTPAPNLEANWKLWLGAANSRDEFNQKSVVKLRGDLNLNYHLAPWLNLNASPTLKNSSGYSQAQEEAEGNSGGAKIILRNATTDFLFLQNSRVQLGVANQQQVHSPLLMADQGFPAARLQLRASEKSSFQWQTFAQTAVPTSSSLATNSREFEPTPTFNSAGVLLGSRRSSMNLSAQLAGFEYRNLPTSVARASGLLGNTVTVNNSTEAQFTSGYRGLEALFGLQLDLSPRWQIDMTANATRNTEAPNEFNQGYVTELGALYHASSRLSFGPFVQSFRIEPDAAVAYYNSENLNTNRVGYRTGLALELSRRFRLTLAGGERGLIYENSAQSRERTIDFGLETFNANF